MSDETAIQELEAMSPRWRGDSQLKCCGVRDLADNIVISRIERSIAPWPLMSSTASVTSVNAAASPALGQVRLAELMAALSLGVDLGFGQPMEHVLRQSMISLRLAETFGLSEDERSVVYYEALLVNVGCHSDAHEQAKWFGDDIALKSNKYDHELGSLSGALATMRLLGSGNPPLHRFRVSVEFALSGHRDMSNMIAQHSALARGLAEQLGLSQAVQEAVGTAYEQWDGKGWPGNLRGNAIPIASRLAQIESSLRLPSASAARLPL